MRERLAVIVRSTLLAPLLLLAVYAAASQLVDPDAYLGTDTGAKVATLDVMSERGAWSPEIPYWADELDPEGRVHAVYGAGRNDRDEWVGVTTVPMLLAARPLYDLGGLRLALLLPMVGAVAAAAGARALARRLGATDGGALAFWVVGLGSPAAIYALDLWEHSIGLALMAWGFVAVLDAVLDRRPAAVAGLLAGVAFGASFTMRTESVVFAAAGFGVAGLQLLGRRRVRDALALGVAGLAGAGALAAAGSWLEGAVHAQSRSSRATATATVALSDTGDRVNEAVRTLLAVDAGDVARAVSLGAALALAIALGVRAERRQEHPIALGAALVVAVVVLVRAVDGLGFVPGLLAASPVAVLAFVTADERPGRRAVLAMALLALPVVWATQYTGGAGPQWGGRYVLPAGLLLVALGTSGRPSDVPRRAVVGVVGVAVAITALGVAWTAERTDRFAGYFDDVLAQPEDVVIAVNPFLPREAGPRIFDARFLSPPREQEWPVAVDVARRAGECAVGVIGWRSDPPDETRFGSGVRFVEERPLRSLGGPSGFAVYDICDGD